MLTSKLSRIMLKKKTSSSPKNALPQHPPITEKPMSPRPIANSLANKLFPAKKTGVSPRNRKPSLLVVPDAEPHEPESANKLMAAFGNTLIQTS